MVLGAIAVLTVMLADFQDETSTELAAAVSDRDGVQAEFAARGATNLARLLIASEPSIRAAITPLFAFLGKKPP
ncbi:MAG: type II secretion system protein GspK, partial [Polyangiaceae bacterium]